MDCPESPREIAAKCRRLAEAISDGPVKDSLTRLAEEYERSGAVNRGREPRTKNT